jgi:hypothetical protein
MITQERFDELVRQAERGGNYIPEAIKAAAHESIVAERAKYAELKEAAGTLAGAFFRLDKYGYIQTNNDEEEGQCKHWRDIGRRAMDQIRSILNRTAHPPTAEPLAEVRPFEPHDQLFPGEHYQPAPDRKQPGQS